MAVVSWSYGSWMYVQSVPITTKVVSSNTFHGEVYSIQHYVIKFVWNIVESGIKHHKPTEPNQSLFKY